MSKDAAGAKGKKRNRIKESLGLEVHEEEEKASTQVPQKRGRPKKQRLFEGSAESANLSSSQSDSRSNTPASQAPPAVEELVSFDHSDDMLFVGLIDSVRDEASYRQLEINMIVHGDKYKSSFWEEYKPEPQKLVKQVKPKTAEEVKATLELMKEAEDVLDHKQYTGAVFYRPRKDTSKRFIDNLEKISGQLYVQNQPIKDVAKYYKMSTADMRE